MIDASCLDVPDRTEICLSCLSLLSLTSFLFQSLHFDLMNNNQRLLMTSLVLTGLIMTIVPFASAEQVAVSLPSGSGVPGCEETQECYIPYVITVNPGDEVVWSNDDTAAHTVTSGTPAEGHDGLFDSSLFMAATTFSHTFDTLGEYDYFCMVHPWMIGNITVN